MKGRSIRLGVCNELFGSLDFVAACRMAAAAGFSGLEIAPFTLSENPAAIGNALRRELARTMVGEGLECVGLHWLLNVPRGLHITCTDERIRRASWAHLQALAGLCRELGGVRMILGSGRQRSAVDCSPSRAREILIEELVRFVPILEQWGVVLCLEALPPGSTNLVNTLAEAGQIVEAVASPWVRGMFDFQNAVSEQRDWVELIRRHWKLIAHVHLNTSDGRQPTEASAPLRAAFRVLRNTGYRDWVCLEVFHLDEDPASVLTATRAVVDELECI